MAETTFVKYFLNNVEILLVILLFVLCYDHVVVILCVLSHSCNLHRLSTDLTQSPTVVNCAVAELELFL